MPEPPSVSYFTRYVLENPWPLAGGLALIAAWLIWAGMREGLMNKVKIGAGLIATAVAVAAAGVLVTTSGEHARIITRRMVDAAVAGDVAIAMAQFEPSAVFAVGSPRNPGYDVSYIEDQLIALASRYKIESNTITRMRGYSESSDAAVVHMACFTQAAQAMYPAVSTWVVRVQRQSDGEWRVAHLTCVAINDQTPQIGSMR